MKIFTGIFQTKTFIYGMNYLNQDVTNEISRDDRSQTSLESITVPTPTVRAIVGTLDKSFPKNLALATTVSFARVLTRVRDTNDEPGSLKAI